MLQRFPLLRGRLLYLLELSSLRTRIVTTARLLSSDIHNWNKQNDSVKTGQRTSNEKKYFCPICGSRCKCSAACDHVKNNFRYYASAAALLLAAGLVFKKWKKRNVQDTHFKTTEVEVSDGATSTVLTNTEVLLHNSGPFEHDAIPEEIPYLLIGAGTASYYAALTIRARDADAKILVVGDERYLPYNRPNLTKELWWYGDDKVAETLEYKNLSGRTKDIYYETKGFYVSPSKISFAEHGGVSLLTGHRVVKLDIPAHMAYLDDGRKIKYGKCLIATGLSPCSLPLFENSVPAIKERLFLYQTVDDFKRLHDAAKYAKSITIIGSNILASELAYSLNRKFGEKGVKINQVFEAKGIVAEIFPEYLSKIATDELRKAGVNIVAEEMPVNAVLSEDGGIKLIFTSGEEILTDYVVVVTHSKANTELASSSGLEVDKIRGGFLVDAELRARTDVWVAGAACNYYDVRLGRRRAKLWDNANVTGRLAGENMTGGQKPYWHQAAYYSVVAPGVHFQGVGRTEPSLPTVSVFASESANEENGCKPERGVVFYLDGKTVVGVVLYNIFGYGVDVARRIIADGREHEEKDLKEIAKLFELHKSYDVSTEENVEDVKASFDDADATTSEEKDSPEIISKGQQDMKNSTVFNKEEDVMSIENQTNQIPVAKAAERNTSAVEKTEGDRETEMKNDGLL